MQKDFEAQYVAIEKSQVPLPESAVEEGLILG